MITTNAPNSCNKVSLSFKKIAAKTMVEFGPIPATIAKFEELIIFIEADTKKEGITVAKTAIKNPNIYTSHEKLKRLISLIIL